MWNRKSNRIRGSAGSAKPMAARGPSLRKTTRARRQVRAHLARRRCPLLVGRAAQFRFRQQRVDRAARKVHQVGHRRIVTMHAAIDFDDLTGDET